MKNSGVAKAYKKDGYKFLEVTNINASYGKKQVLFDVSFQMKKGETILLVGSNGSGKSSLLKVIYGLLKPWNNKEATIWFKNKEISNCNPAQLLKKGMVYIPQKNELFEDLSVKENLEISGMQTMNKKELQNRIDEVLERIPNLRKLITQECGLLSGGERKQLSLAMALINKPDIVIFDEPLAGITPNNLNVIIEHLEKLKELGIAMLLVEHRIKTVFHLADRIIELKLGKAREREVLLESR